MILSRVYSPGNMRHLALENDYLTDEGIHGGAQASAILHDNQQDVRLITSTSNP